MENTGARFGSPPGFFDTCAVPEYGIRYRGQGIWLLKPASSGRSKRSHGLAVSGMPPRWSKR